MSSSSTSRRLVALSALLLGALGLAVTGWQMRHKLPLPTTTVGVGKPLPSIVVSDPTGRPVDLATVVGGGSRSVIVFYSPSCGVCQKELPQIGPFPPELRLVLVREPGDDMADPLASAVSQRFADRDGALKRAFVLPVLPTVLLVDERGFVRDGFVGEHEARSAQQKLVAFARRGR